jgi:short subunit dehydrogenase-like uncharacterized protein
MAETRDFGLTVFGATGFTGGLCAEYLGEHLPDDIPWALAGRNAEKLQAVHDALAASGVANLPTLLSADINDQASLEKMALRSKVIITTVGPYVWYGEGLVRACADNGTHYCDLTGEPEFVCNMITRYHQSARKTGAAIVNCCGFDSIPHDAGALFTMRELARACGGPPQGRVTLQGVVTASGTFSGGTWQSALTAFGRPRENQIAMRHARMLLDHEYPKTAHALAPLPRRDTELGGWLCPMPTIDPFMVMRSARAVSGYGNDFHYGHYLASKSLPKMVGGIGGIGGLLLAAQIKPVRERLLTLRQSGEGPAKEKRDRSWFKVTFRGEADGTRVITQVSGGDPGYDETAKMLAETAMGLALDKDAPRATGVVTPVMALEDGLVKRLQKARIHFQRLI